MRLESAKGDVVDVIVRGTLPDKRAFGLSWLDLNKFNQIRQFLGEILIVVNTLLCSKRGDQAWAAV